MDQPGWFLGQVAMVLVSLFCSCGEWGRRSEDNLLSELGRSLCSLWSDALELHATCWSFKPTLD